MPGVAVLGDPQGGEAVHVEHGGHLTDPPRLGLGAPGGDEVPPEDCGFSRGGLDVVVVLRAYTVNRSVVIAAPTKVQWSAYLNRADGRVYAAVTVYGNTPEGDPWNTSFLPDFEDVPSWIPAPPAWYVDAVAELRAAGEDLSKRVSR